NTQQMQQLMQDTSRQDMARWLAVAPVEEAKVQLTGAGHLSGSSLNGLQADLKYRYKGSKQNEWYTAKRSFDITKTQAGTWVITGYAQVDQPAF
ncbi:hypothetical protein, partial [Acinetobacter baumannii]|uniref:hypothetical protein n=1 Tax=Acinetobacter baumannii TaxID=470 RepID=UPI000AC4DD83